MRNKSISRDKLHQEFEELLQRLQPSERVIQVFQLSLQRLIEESGNDKDLVITSLKNNLKSVDDKVQRYIDRI
jgi:hypothetical protein